MILNGEDTSVGKRHLKWPHRAHHWKGASPSSLHRPLNIAESRSFVLKDLLLRTEYSSFQCLCPLYPRKLNSLASFLSGYLAMTSLLVFILLLPISIVKATARNWNFAPSYLVSAVLWHHMLYSLQPKSPHYCCVQAWVIAQGLHGTVNVILCPRNRPPLTISGS